MILGNLSRIELMPARLACMAPEAAERILEQGKQVGIGSGDHVFWHYAPILIEAFAVQRPDLLDRLLAPAEAAAAKAFSRLHPSWYKEAGPTLVALRHRAPQALARILDRVTPQCAEVGWTAALREGRGARCTVAHLVTVATERTDSIGDLARRLRARFPESGWPVELRSSTRP